MAADELVIHKGRTNTFDVEFGEDISGRTYTAEVRQGPDQESPLIMSFTTSFDTDGTDGILVLSVDDAVTGTIAETSGYMDIKEVVGGEPLSVSDRPLRVELRATVTQ